MDTLPLNSATEAQPAKPSRRRRRGCRYWVRLALFGIASCIVIFLPAWEYAYVAEMVSPAPAKICCRTPNDLGLSYEKVTIHAPDGIDLSGWYIPSRNGAVVIFLHGYGATRMEMLDRAAALAREDFGALLYDLRGHGESGGAYRAMGWPDAADLTAVVDFLATRPEIRSKEIGGFGFSIGGQILLRAAADDQRIRAVVVDDPGYARAEDIPPMSSAAGVFEAKFVVPLDLSLISARSGVPIPAGVADAIPRLAPRPLLLIASGQSDMSRDLERYFYSLAGEPKQLWEIPEAGHGGTYAARSAEYESKLLKFFAGSLHTP
jgi:uncharacterized protein